MTGATVWLFYVAFAGLVAHEIDAVHKREWRLLFVLRRMPEERARRAFVLLHVPLLAVLLGLVAHPDTGIRFWAMFGLDVFLVAHAGLHGRLAGHPAYAFATTHSRLLIVGPAVLAAGHLLAMMLTR